VGLAPGVKGTILKWGGAGPGNENVLAELSQSLIFSHIWLSEVDGPVLTRPPGSSIYDCYLVAKSRQNHHGSPWAQFGGGHGGRVPLTFLHGGT